MAIPAVQVHNKIPKTLFWSAPLSADSDFTAEDPLALDYLGQQVGNWLFRGFTTRTSRAQYYAVVLYGLHLVDLAITAHGHNHRDDRTRNQLFERWERFWALATLESRNGDLQRGDQDAMRGVRGATREWTGGSKPLRLDFPLISRQLELGGLGAYLTSLRDYGLVFPGTMRVTPAAKGILDAFWSEPGQRKAKRYQEFALHALDLNETRLPRKYSGLSLRKVGELTRLSAIRERPEQQDRLWNQLFAESKDGSTFQLSQQLRVATGEGIDNAAEILEGMLAGRWGELTDECRSKVELAMCFGSVAQRLLNCFDRAYEYLDQHSWSADRGEVAQAAFPADDFASLQSMCHALTQTDESLRFSQLQFHGPVLLTLLKKLATADQHSALDHLLWFHRTVQKSRRGSGAWIRDESEKLVLNISGYNGYKKTATFPNLKLDVVRQLLADLGRLA